MIEVITPFEEHIFNNGIEWLTEHNIDWKKRFKAFRRGNDDFTKYFLMQYNLGLAYPGFWTNDTDPSPEGLNLRLCWTFEDDEKDWAMMFKLTFG